MTTFKPHPHVTIYATPEMHAGVIFHVTELPPDQTTAALAMSADDATKVAMAILEAVRVASRAVA
jgi:hypothetical protein